MAKELPYFQFEPAEYLTGSIQFCSLAAQGLFTNIQAVYWQRGCELTLDQAKKRFNHESEIQELITENIIKVDDGKIVIQFLDNQYNSAIEKSKKNSENGKKGAYKKYHNSSESIATPEIRYSEPLGIRRDKIKEDNKRKDNKKVFTPPILDEVKKYFIERGYTESSAEKAFNYYSTADWIDSNNKPVLNWKQKMIAVWFKPENEIPTLKPRTLQL